MIRIVYDIVEEPRGEVYQSLVHHCMGLGLDFLLVERSGVSLDTGAKAVLRRLEPHRVERDQRSEWPGTELYGHTALVSRYRAGSAATATLTEAARGLYDWVAPELPEDLCFLRPDGSTYLATIAHERDAFLELSPAERAVLLAAVPGIRVERNAEQ